MIDYEKIRGAVERGEFDFADGGLYVPSAKILVHGRFVYNKRGEPEEFSDNLVVTEGLNYLLGSALRGVTPISSWFIAPFSGDVTVQATWTAANFTANATEVTAYSDSNRPDWTPAVVSGGAITSFAAKAEFEATSAVTIRGAALISASAKSATTGTLVAASRFGSAKPLETGEILDVGYSITLTPS